MNRTVANIIQGRGPVRSVNRFLSCQQAANIINEYKMSAIGVVTNGKFDGIFSESSVFHAVTGNKQLPMTTHVQNMMIKAADLPSVMPSTAMFVVLKLADTMKLTHFPIIDAQGVFYGLISIKDDLSTAVKEFDEGLAVVDEIEKEVGHTLESTPCVSIPKRKIKGWISTLREIFENRL